METQVTCPVCGLVVVYVTNSPGDHTKRIDAEAYSAKCELAEDRTAFKFDCPNLRAACDLIAKPPQSGRT
jgi:predicted RNA-binding Zn-ribbon protein involved in translation (DUF1610 family)